MASHGVPRREATLEQRTPQQSANEQTEIEKYKSLVDLIETKIAERQYTAGVLQLTSKLLTKNPEYYTIWNARRRLLIYGMFCKSSDSSSLLKASHNTSPTSDARISSDDSSSSTADSSKDSNTTLEDQSRQNHGKSGTILELIQAELDFVVPLLKKWPKCYWIWAYRTWVLYQAVQRLDAPVARRLWQAELALVSMMLVRDSRNFHGWGYRRLVVEQLESRTLNGQSMVESEFAYTTKMISAHLSNFSAWHYRSKLIPRLLDERKADDIARRIFLEDEFDLMKTALWTDAYDQSLWFYHQFLMTTLLSPIGRATIVPHFSLEERSSYVLAQLVDLKDMLDGAEDCKYIYIALFDNTLAMTVMEERVPSLEEKSDLKSWLAELRKLDPLRGGRWDDLEKSLHFM